MCSGIIVAAISVFTMVYGLGANAAQADSRARLSWSAQLTSWKIDKNSPFGSVVYGGNVRVDLARRMAYLNLDVPFPCPPGEFCIEIVQVVEIALPITNIYQDDCGNINVVALKNNQPADGAKETLTIIDASRNQCLFKMAIPATVIVYETEIMPMIPGAPISRTTSLFAAKPLRFGR